jgi:hypothetical protein
MTSRSPQIGSRELICSTRSHLAPVRVLRCSSPRHGFELPPHTTFAPFEESLSTPPARCEEDASFRLLQPILDTSTCRTFDSRGERRARALRSRATEPRPQRTTRVKAQLTLRSQLRTTRARSPSSCDEVVVRRTFLVGSSDRRTLVAAHLRRGVLSHRRGVRVDL